MKAFSDYLYAKSGWPIGLLFTVATSLYLVYIMTPASECLAVDGLAQFTVSFGYSKETILAHFSRLGVEGLACFRQFIIVYDNIFPLLYGGAFISWASYLLRGHLGKFWWVNVFPIALIVLDWIENTHAYLMAGWFAEVGDLSDATVMLGSGLTMMKWVALVLSSLLLVVGAFYRLKRYFT